MSDVFISYARTQEQAAHRVAEGLRTLGYAVWRDDELPACAELYVRVLTETFTWMPADRHQAADFLRAAEEEDVFVAVEGERIVGLAALYPPQSFLHSLYVADRGRATREDPEDRREGSAQAGLSLEIPFGRRDE